MTARVALKAAFRNTVIPVLRGAGFRGTFPTWRLAREGDLAIVNVQSGHYNEGDEGEFFVNLSVVPASWWEWTHECAGGHIWGSISEEGRAKDTDGLYRGRLARPGRRGYRAYEWALRSEDADPVSAAMARAFEGRGLPTMFDLMGPGRMLRAVRSGRIDQWTPVGDRINMRDIVEAVLLSDVGGEDLEAVCRRLDSLAGGPFSELPLLTATWARHRAKGRGLH